MNENTKALRKALKRKKTFTDGTVIRWTSSDRYIYAAIYIESMNLWYTTVSRYNTYVQKTMKTDDLVGYLKRGDVTDVVVAINWEEV